MDVTVLRMVLFTLNDIEVKGKENLSKLLGCIETLEACCQATERPAATVEEVKEDG